VNKSKTIAVVVAAVVLGAALFGGGYLVATKVSGTNSSSPSSRFGANGPFAQLTDAERQQLQNMTAEERQQFFQEKGIQLPQGGDGSFVTSGTAGGQGGRVGRSTSLFEGTVASVSADTVTIALSAGGSVNIYLDSSTVKAAVAGAKADVVSGAKVLVYAQPEATGVTAAKAIIVQ
jgi:hypothetical protein